MAPETFADIDLDPFVSYLSDLDPNTPAPNSSGGRRDEDSRWTGFWGGPQTGYQRVSVANEDVKKPDASTSIHLSNNPAAYFKLTLIELSKCVPDHVRSTVCFPGLVLNNFEAMLGRTVGRMPQITFPRCPSSHNFAFSADLKAYPDAHKSADRYNVARDRALLHLKVPVTEN